MKHIATFCRRSVSIFNLSKIKYCKLFCDSQKCLIISDASIPTPFLDQLQEQMHVFLATVTYLILYSGHQGHQVTSYFIAVYISLVHLVAINSAYVYIYAHTILESCFVS